MTRSNPQDRLRRVKLAAKRHLPQRYLTRRVRRHQQKVRRQAGVPRLARSFVERHGPVVMRGPFTGLRYRPGRIPEIDAPVAKLLGAYEEELHDVLEHALRDEPPAFIDIGAAEGYYAVGFAVKSPRTVVHAFEMDRWARKRLDELAALNGVIDRVRVNGICNAQALRDLVATDAFVLSDCEGAEVEIFTADIAETLRTSTVLIELHDDLLGFDALAVLEPRFAATHAATEIRGRKRDPHRFPELASLSAGDRRLALEELRGGGMRWVVFTPRAGSVERA